MGKKCLLHFLFNFKQIRSHIYIPFYACIRSMKIFTFCNIYKLQQIIKVCLCMVHATVPPYFKKLMVKYNQSYRMLIRMQMLDAFNVKLEAFQNQQYSKKESKYGQLIKEGKPKQYFFHKNLLQKNKQAPNIHQVKQILLKCCICPIVQKIFNILGRQNHCKFCSAMRALITTIILINDTQYINTEFPIKTNKFQQKLPAKFTNCYTHFFKIQATVQSNKKLAKKVQGNYHVINIISIFLLLTKILTRLQLQPATHEQK
eukprot:TRINITY_DN3546_c0_g1_i2.p3 TRINITY_DN3546_c0_g1~~TRINITY_DN3546_c0_g1_i2.p3  ORF type:complete len:259 (-),score=-10.51 TRINITY_DN3546_c0_g1_i2:501-1277(-)